MTRPRLRRGAGRASRAGRRGRDLAGSSTIGFIVAMVMLVGSMGTVTYYVSSINEGDHEVGTTDQQTAATRAAELLTTSPGEPADWELSPSGMVQAGLRNQTRAGTLPYDKILHLRDGTVGALDLLDGLDLRDKGVSMRVEGRVVPSPLLTPPGSDTYVVAHYTSATPSGGHTIDPVSDAYIDLLAKYDRGFVKAEHDWAFDWDGRPEVGLGNVHPDQAWYVETGLGPQLSGIRATYATRGNLNVTPNPTAEQALYDVYNAGETKFNRWRLASTSALELPVGGPPNGDFALAVGYKHKGGSDNGIGTWRSVPGDRAWALVGPIDASDADALSLDVSYLSKQGSGGERASILFWDETADEWKRIRSNPDCAPGGTGWDDESYGTGGAWATATVDLCQPLTDGLGTVWLAFYWNTWCGAIDAEAPCVGGSPSIAGWFLDRVTVRKTVGSQVSVAYDNDMAPRTNAAHQLLYLSHGVDHGLVDDGPSDDTIFLIEPIKGLVDNGGNVLAMPAGTAGNWLGSLGLQAQAAAATQPVVSATDPYAYFTMPNALPTEHALYVSSALAWAKSTTDPLGGTPTQPLVALQEVQGTGQGTVLWGLPRGVTGGSVTATSYPLAAWVGTPENLLLRDHTMENLYAVGVFEDPTFTTSGFSVPTSGVKVSSARRATLAEVTYDGIYTVPFEVRVFLWEVAQGP